MSRWGHRLAALGLLAALLALAWLGAIEPAARALDLGDEIAAARLQLVHLERLTAAGRAAVEPAPVPTEPGADGYEEAASDSLALVALQTRLIELAERARLTIQSVEPGRPGPDPAGTRLTATLAFTAPLAAVLQFVQAVEAGRPLMLVDELELHSAGTAILHGRLTIASFRRGGA